MSTPYRAPPPNPSRPPLVRKAVLVSLWRTPLLIAVACLVGVILVIYSGQSTTVLHCARRGSEPGTCTRVVSTPLHDSRQDSVDLSGLRSVELKIGQFQQTDASGNRRFYHAANVEFRSDSGTTAIWCSVDDPGRIARIRAFAEDRTQRSLVIDCAGSGDGLLWFFGAALALLALAFAFFGITFVRIRADDHELRVSGLDAHFLWMAAGDWPPRVRLLTGDQPIPIWDRVAWSGRTTITTITSIDCNGRNELVATLADGTSLILTPPLRDRDAALARVRALL